MWDKVKEEIREFQTEVDHMDKEKAEAAFGDVMFSLINAARLYKINPDLSLIHISCEVFSMNLPGKNVSWPIITKAKST